jgi:D-aminoacyl-tRNA deacylase
VRLPLSSHGREIVSVSTSACDTDSVRALVQRVTQAEVRSRKSASDTPDTDDFHVAGRIGPGLCVLVGVTHSDSHATAIKMADKIWNLRILDDADGVMNLSPAQVAAMQATPPGIMVVSQFTLYGDTSRGRRPSWIDAAPPEQAEPMVDQVVEELRRLGAEVATGVFRSEMRVELINDGPVTVLLEL